jgi:hypothetical protein
MVAPLLFDAVREITATTGTGPIVLSGATPPFRSFAAAGVPDGAKVRYSIATPATFPTALEWGDGVYTLATSGLTRNMAGSTTGALLVLSGISAVSITPLAVDFTSPAFTAQRVILASPDVPVYSDDYLFIATTGACTINLPSISSRNGRPIRIKDMSGLTGHTITCNGSDLFEGGVSYFSFFTPYQGQSLIPTTIGGVATWAVM